MFRYFKETLPGVQFRDSDHVLTCASDCVDIGGKFSLYAIAEYIPRQENSGTAARDIVAAFTESAGIQLMEKIFADDSDSGSDFFRPVFEAAELDAEADSTPRRKSQLDMACLIVENDTLKVRFAARGKIHIILFDKEGQDYEYAWPRFGGVTTMWGFAQLHDKYNLLLANEAMFRLLYNSKEDRLYKVYEEMMLTDIDQPFHLKALSDLTYFTVELDSEMMYFF